MKHKNSNLPVDPRNWSEMKKAIPGLKEAARGPLRPISNISDLLVLYCSFSGRGSTYEHSVRTLKEKEHRLLTLEEAAYILTHYPDKLNSLKGRSFYIEGEGNGAGGYHTIRDDGSVHLEMSKNLERSLYYHSGNLNISLIILQDNEAIKNNGRFCLDARNLPSNHVTAIVGLPKDMPVNSICKDARC